LLNFLGIGAQKCGTTWLFETLSAHPKICFPAGKEVHYWNHPNDRSVDWYAELFSDNKLCNGEITPAYGILPTETINRIHSRWPNLRLIYLIRNPIDRAWSAARMALMRAEMTHEEASDAWFIDHFYSQGSLARGDYEACIRNWLSIYPKEQLLVLSLEMITANPVAMANRCLTHIGASPIFTSSDRENLLIKLFEGDRMPLRPSLAPVLHGIYKEKNKFVSEYLNEI
jgi:hypothetical protein